MTVTVACPNCRRMPEIANITVLKSGLVLTCPDCDAQIRVDLVKFVAQPKPVQMRRSLIVETA